VLRFLTSGESHGKGLIGIIEGMPAGISVNEEYVNRELQRRQKGYGRGGRMAVESDTIEIFSGVRNGRTIGSPIGFLIRNKDYQNWRDVMAVGECDRAGDKEVRRPRPGHADLPGGIKYNQPDMRNILERASARETAARVAAGAIIKKLLDNFDIHIYSQVLSVGGVAVAPYEVNEQNLDVFCDIVESSPIRCADIDGEAEMIKLIEKARKDGESLGGVFEVGAVGVPPGLGSHVSWDRKLDAQIAGLLMSIPAIKAVEIGDGVMNASRPGSEVHDEIYYGEEQGIYRKTNRAGGLEGGITNGETVWARAYMKPIPTLYKPLTSVNTLLWQQEKADVERSDICAVPAAAVVGEAMFAFGIARAFLEKLGGDSVDEIEKAYCSYKDYMKRVWKWERI